MKKIIKTIAIEITRRCNENCPHCMRGNSQNIDLKKQDIDKLFKSNKSIIGRIVFSGGEPLLNEDIIIYTIDKIINEKIPVLCIELTTNSTIYSQKIIDAFNRFYTFYEKNYKIASETFGYQYPTYIRFSNDQFHKKYDKNITELFLKNGNNIHFEQTGTIDILDDKIISTGRAKENFLFGKFFNYEQNNIEIKKWSKDIFFIDNSFYITALGNITTQGDGTYQDMDKNNLGNIHNTSIEEIIENKIKEEEKKIKKLAKKQS